MLQNYDKNNCINYTFNRKSLSLSILNSIKIITFVRLPKLTENIPSIRSSSKNIELLYSVYQHNGINLTINEFCKQYSHISISNFLLKCFIPGVSCNELN